MLSRRKKIWDGLSPRRRRRVITRVEFVSYHSFPVWGYFFLMRLWEGVYGV